MARKGSGKHKRSKKAHNSLSGREPKNLKSERDRLVRCKESGNLPKKYLNNPRKLDSRIHELTEEINRRNHSHKQSRRW